MGGEKTFTICLKGAIIYGNYVGKVNCQRPLLRGFSPIKTLKKMKTQNNGPWKSFYKYKTIYVFSILFFLNRYTDVYV